MVGRLTKDPVLRKTGSGASVVSFTVACDRRIKTEGQPTADFINCVCWNKVADNMHNIHIKVLWLVWKEESRHAVMMIKWANVCM